MKTAVLGDVAGGPIVSTAQSFVRIHGKPVATNNPATQVAPHYEEPPHIIPGLHMVGSLQSFVTINGSNITIDGDLALCFDTVNATEFVNIN